jgi:DNA replicative helicase MCM subunit Mcm2 (Cdc46/Mcm family)
MIRDVLDRTMDQKISEHILNTHKSGEKLRQSEHTGIALKKKKKKKLKK